MSSSNHDGLDSHAHPTFGVCLCGHLDFMHPWKRERIEFMGECGNDECECKGFHADPLTKGQGR